MKVTIGIGGATLHREAGDGRLYKESTVGYKLKLLLNATGEWNFVRYYPDRENMTSCRLGLIDRERGVVLWHERHAIEDAAKEFNSGSVFLQRVNFDPKEEKRAKTQKQTA